jgi:hypothetical protein
VKRLIEQVRQGDILKRKIDSMPSGRHTVSKNNVLAEGEISGHKHLLKGPSAKLLMMDRQEGQIIGHIDTGDQKATVWHDEHNEVPLDANAIYEVRRQREFKPKEGTRNVQD